MLHPTNIEDWKDQHYQALLKELETLDSQDNNFLRSLLGPERDVAYIEAEIADEVAIELDDLTLAQTGEDRSANWYPVAHCRLGEYYQAATARQITRSAIRSFQQKLLIKDLLEACKTALASFDHQGMDNEARALLVQVIARAER